MTEDELKVIEVRADAATKGPWRALEDGNQYIHGPKGDCYLPTAKVVAAALVEGLVRPWNPHALTAFMKLDDAWVCRFLSDDAQFIAHSRTDIPALCAEVRRLRRLSAESLHRRQADEAKRDSLLSSDVKDNK